MVRSLCWSARYADTLLVVLLVLLFAFVGITVGITIITIFSPLRSLLLDHGPSLDQLFERKQ